MVLTAEDDTQQYLQKVFFLMCKLNCDLIKLQLLKWGGLMDYFGLKVKIPVG